MNLLGQSRFTIRQSATLQFLSEPHPKYSDPSTDGRGRLFSCQLLHDEDRRKGPPTPANPLMGAGLQCVRLVGTISASSECCEDQEVQ